jgi:hypothetical protein
MFEPQPVVGADIYVFKWIFHDWPDVESLAILRALIPALKPGARIVFIDYVGTQEPSEVALPRSIQGFGTATDLRMMEIFTQADERFEVKRVDADPLTFMCVLEAVWRG